MEKYFSVVNPPILSKLTPLPERGIERLQQLDCCLSARPRLPDLPSETFQLGWKR